MSCALCGRCEWMLSPSPSNSKPSVRIYNPHPSPTCTVAHTCINKRGCLMMCVFSPRPRHPPSPHPTRPPLVHHSPRVSPVTKSKQHGQFRSEHCPHKNFHLTRAFAVSAAFRSMVGGSAEEWVRTNNLQSGELVFETQREGGVWRARDTLAEQI